MLYHFKRCQACNRNVLIDESTGNFTDYVSYHALRELLHNGEAMPHGDTICLECQAEQSLAAIYQNQRS